MSHTGANKVYLDGYSVSCCLMSRRHNENFATKEEDNTIKTLLPFPCLITENTDHFQNIMGSKSLNALYSFCSKLLKQLLDFYIDRKDFIFQFERMKYTLSDSDTLTFVVYTLKWKYGSFSRHIVRHSHLASSFTSS